MPGIEKTIYILPTDTPPLFSVALELPGVEDLELAADRLRSTWKRAADPSSHTPFGQFSISSAFARENVPSSPPKAVRAMDAEIAKLFSLEDSGRVFWVWRHSTLDSAPQVEPQIEVLETGGGEARLRHVKSTSLREFVADNIAENDADQSQLYRIRVSQAEGHLIHGVNVEHALNLVRHAAETGHSPYMPDQALAVIDQLERALADHQLRNEATALKP